MFIRASSQKNKNTGQSYTTYRLVETYRNQDGKVRQQTLLNLGCHFEVPSSQWKVLADRIEEIQRGQASLLTINESLENEAQRIAKLVTHKMAVVGGCSTGSAESPADGTDDPSQSKVDARPLPAPDYQTVDVNSLDHRDIRYVGVEYVGYHAARQLGMEALLLALGFNQKQTHIALATIIGRLVHPGSDLSTHRYLTKQSALDELLGADFSSLPLTSFYRLADKLYHHHQAIEQALYQQEKDLFNLSETITLYDITNTYFEGRCDGNNKAHYGRSKEKRSDCPLVSLGIVLDGSGFPKKSHILPGNVSEPKTLQDMLGALEAKSTTTVVMDAGIATEDNITWLRETGYEYIVVSRKPHLVMPADTAPVIVKQVSHNIVKAVLVKNETTDELELYCHSQAKEQKSIQMTSKMEARYETALQKLAHGLTKKGCTKKYDKVMEKLGRLKEQYKRINKHYDIQVTADTKSTYAAKIVWKKNHKPDNESLGVYCLRTNKKGLDEQSLWTIYTMLTDLEAAFRSLKSELGLRPVYHQTEARVDAHIFISVLAYHLLHTLRYQLKNQGIHHSWQTLRELLHTQCRITSRLRLEDGRVLHIRKTTLPDVDQKAIDRALGISTHPGNVEKTYA